MTANLPVVFDPRSVNDIDTIVQWYVEQRLELFQEFLDELDVALERVTQYPYVYREIDRGIRRVLMKKFPYFIYYAIDCDRIIIFAVLHAHRVPDTWKQRLE